MIEELTKLVKENPNDMDLGAAIRRLQLEIISVEIDGKPIHIKVMKEYPNDNLLGKYIRYLLYNSIYHDVV